MNSVTAAHLIEINREFYSRFGGSFSSSRRRLQPGVRKILGSIGEQDRVLDLGCGNGHFLREILQRGHSGPLLGLDFSRPLLQDAGSSPGLEFCEVDLTNPSAMGKLLSRKGSWNWITMFATLHHIPSRDIRLELLKMVRKSLPPHGRFVLSNWQFLNSEKLKARIQPWSRVGLSDKDVDQGDHLIDWRSGGEGLRYVHHFSADELLGAAGQAGMRVDSQFLSDGENGRLGLYQVWTPS